MKYKLGVIAVLLVGLLAVGCGGKKNSERAKWGRPAKQPPTYPKAVNEPVDSALRNAARLEIVTAGQSPDALLRAQSIEAVKMSMPVDGRAQILTGLDDSRSIVRKAAAFAAGELKLAEAKPRLEKLATDPSPNVRVAARFALHRLGDSRLTHDLENFARDVDPTVRGDTVLALGLLKEPSALKILRVMLRDSDVSVRLQALESMWRLGDKEGLQGLVAGSISSFPDEQLFCILALAAPRNPVVMGHIRGVLVTDYEEVNLVAARAAGMLGSDEGYGVAMKGIKSSDARQRALAAFAFGAIGRVDAQSQVAPLLKDNQPYVRLAGATAILQLGQKP